MKSIIIGLTILTLLVLAGCGETQPEEQTIESQYVTEVLEDTEISEGTKSNKHYVGVVALDEGVSVRSEEKGEGVLVHSEGKGKLIVEEPTSHAYVYPYINEEEGCGWLIPNFLPRCSGKMGRG